VRAHVCVGVTETERNRQIQRKKEKEHVCIMHVYWCIPLLVQRSITQNVMKLGMNFVTLEAIIIALFSYNQYSVLAI